MPIAETWLLPDGVADVLPEQAQVLESFRRQALDFLAVRGYQLVYTPFIEYVESLSCLSESNQDLDLVTFKLIDPLSGRLMGVRADMTPQVARIDAHVHAQQGVARYCYAGTVLHSKPQNFNSSRAPLQLGAELYGHDSIEADVEMIDVMLGILAQAHALDGAHLDLGHVGLFRSLIRFAGLDKNSEQQLSDLYQRKALPELKALTQNLAHGDDFYALGRYACDLSQLEQHLSAVILADADFSDALQNLKLTLNAIQQRWPQLSIGIDAVELRSYHYHTGLMYAVYAPERAAPLAQGGRYDGIGEHYGRARAATGFSCDLYALCANELAAIDNLQSIVAPQGRDPELLAAIDTLRSQGRSVVQLLGQDAAQSLPQATAQLVCVAGQWQVKTL